MSLNQSPQFKYEVLANRFNQAYHQPTSGSQGAGILKWLHEDMNVMDGSPAFSALERAATVLQEKGNEDPHPMIYGQINGAYYALMEQWKDEYYGAPTPRQNDLYEDGLSSADEWHDDVTRGRV